MEVLEMPRAICADILNPETRHLLENEVKRVVKTNKEVFDRLAKK